MRSRLSIATRDAERDAALYVTALARALQDFFVSVNGSRVTVRVGVFRLAHTTFHPFKGVSSAEFQVTPHGSDLRIDYEVRLTALIWMLVMFAVIGTVMALGGGFTWFNAVGPSAAVAVVLAVNWLWTHFAVKRFLRRIGGEVVSAK